MTVPDGPNISSRAPAYNPARVPARTPRRDEIASATVGFLNRGGPSKADLLLVDLGEGEMVVKDFAAKSWWVRALGRIQIRRECRAYRWLGATPGVPAFIGQVDEHALAMEKVDGEQLAFAPDRFESGEAYVERLRALFDRLHSRGLVHHDLRGRENVLVRPGGEPVVVDLAGAVCLRPGGLWHRLFFRWLVLTDEAAYLKWKELLAPGRLSREDRAFLRRFRVLRMLWPFNRKRRAARGGAQ